MKTEKGKLKAIKNGFQVLLPTKKGGSASHPIPASAARFRLQDAADGVEVDVELDAGHRIAKVTIPGKEPASVPRPQAVPSGKHEKRDKPTGSQKPGHKPGQPRAVRGLPKAPPKALGLPFHNPYTFLPFGNTPPCRKEPTPLSIDELPEERSRLTGILELEITTTSPLLTCSPRAVRDENGHKTYEVLKIGPDVIVPATGIRGALRSLLTVLTGGTLGYLNRHAYLCQGRDLNLGPRGPRSQSAPENLFLGEVIEPGTAFRPGRIRVGRARLVKAEVLRVLMNKTPELRARCKEYADHDDILPRKIMPKKKTESVKHLWADLDDNGQPIAISDDPTRFRCPARVKLSGRPVGSRERLENKREGLLPLGDTLELDLPPELWEAYSGRNTHGDRPELKAGDLVWLEPKAPGAERIEKPEDVASIQWARWGRRGEALEERIRRDAPQVVPDSFRNDGLVDEVTDLFGQVPERGCEAPSFGARVRPENLVFFGAAPNVQRVTLAPLAPPHPGCLAFYRQNPDPDAVSESDPIRGYKVYRTTEQRGEEAPWQFSVQAVYGKQGELLRPQQKVNKTCDLLPDGVTGTLRISFRGLTERELALLLQACVVPWRLGGGKPLGLGLCDVRFKRLIGESGERLQVTGWTIQESDQGLIIEGWQKHVQDIQSRVQMWQASQRPVANLGYPRAVDANKFGKSRGGHAWFQRHASPRMVKQEGDDQREPGLEPLYIDGELLEAARAADFPLDSDTPMIAAQVLPAFDPEDPLADLLYGYDGFGAETEDRQQPRRRVFLKVEPFDPAQHVTGTERSQGSHGKNAEFRGKQKKERRSDH